MIQKAFIFVTVGSTDFDELARTVDELAPSLRLQGIMQIGHGQYKPVNFPFFRFSYSLEPYYKKASLAIAHGGLATSVEILKMGIPLVSVSNPDRYDNHQEDLLYAMAKEGYLIWCRQLHNIKEAIQVASATSFRRYEAPACNIQYVIKKFLKKHIQNR